VERAGGKLPSSVKKALHRPGATALDGAEAFRTIMLQQAYSMLKLQSENVFVKESVTKVVKSLEKGEYVAEEAANLASCLFEVDICVLNESRFGSCGRVLQCTYYGEYLPSSHVA
jgi:hypothetical protein